MVPSALKHLPSQPLPSPWKHCDTEREGVRALEHLGELLPPARGGGRGREGEGGGGRGEKGREGEGGGGRGREEERGEGRGRQP